MRISDWSSDVCSSDLRLRIEAADGFLQRGAVDIGDDGGLITLLVATERVDQELGAECRSADADVEDRADRPERLRLYRVDEGAHPGVETLSAGDALRRPLPAFGGMLGRAAFGDIARSDERRVGKECVSTCRSRWSR